MGHLSVATAWSQSGPRSDDNEGVLHIPQRSSITGTSQSDGFVPYPGHSFGVSYPSAEKPSVYSAAPADWTMWLKDQVITYILGN